MAVDGQNNLSAERAVYGLDIGGPDGPLLGLVMRLRIPMNQLFP